MSQADALTGEVTLPQALLTWQGTDGQAETLPKVRQFIKLKHANWKCPTDAIPAEQEDTKQAKLMCDLDELQKALKQKDVEMEIAKAQ